MLTWLHYAVMPEAELARQDVIRTNIACAYGLPGTRDLDPEAVAARCDQMAQRIARVTHSRVWGEHLGEVVAAGRRHGWFPSGRRGHSGIIPDFVRGGEGDVWGVSGVPGFVRFFFGLRRR